MNNKFAISIVAAFLIGAIGGWSFASLQQPVSQEQKLVLPADAEIFIPCVPGHGTHYALPGDIAVGPTDRPWVGPSYVVREDTGNLIGIEYHIAASAIAEEGDKIAILLSKIISGEDLKLLYEHKFPAFKGSYESVDILYIAGHPGFEVPHYDVHLWMLKASEHHNITCPTTDL